MKPNFVGLPRARACLGRAEARAGGKQVSACYARPWERRVSLRGPLDTLGLHIVTVHRLAAGTSPQGTAPEHMSAECPGACMELKVTTGTFRDTA